MSHVDMSAFFSGGDLNDEKASRLFGVIGKLSQEVPEIVVRAASNQQQVLLKLADIFDPEVQSLQEDSDYSVPADSESKIVEISVARGFTTLPYLGNSKPYTAPTPTFKSSPADYTLSSYVTMWACDHVQKKDIVKFKELMERLLPSSYNYKKVDPLTMVEITELFTSLLDIVSYQTLLTEPELAELAFAFNQGLLCVSQEQESYNSDSSASQESSNLLLDDNAYDYLKEDFGYAELEMDMAKNDAKSLIENFHAQTSMLH